MFKTFIFDIISDLIKCCETRILYNTYLMTFYPLVRRCLLEKMGTVKNFGWYFSPGSQHSVYLNFLLLFQYSTCKARMIYPHLDVLSNTGSAS